MIYSNILATGDTCCMSWAGFDIIFTKTILELLKEAYEVIKNNERGLFILLEVEEKIDEGNNGEFLSMYPRCI